MYDLSLIAWLRWRQFWSLMEFWLLAIGINTRMKTLSQRLYTVYVSFFLVPYMAWALLEILSTGARLGGLLGPEGRETGLVALPGAILAAQVVLVAWGLRRSPLQLAGPDVVFVAGQPVSRRAVIVVAFVSALLLSTPLVLLAAAFTGVTLMEAMALTAAGEAAFGAIGVALPLWIFTLALVWFLGLGRLVSRPVRLTGWIWLLPLPLLAAAWFDPGAAGMPGEMLAAGIQGEEPGGSGLLWLAAAGALAALLWLARRIDFRAVVDDSGPPSRLREIATALVLRLPIPPERVHQETRAIRASRRGRLPDLDRAGIAGARSALSFLRAPGTISRLLLDVALVIGGTWIVIESAPVQLWTAYLLLAVIIAPSGMVSTFAATMGQPFLRQFLPVRTRSLLIAEAFVPVLLVLGLSLAGWIALVSYVNVDPSGILVAPLLVFMFVLCQSLDHVRVGQARARIPYRIALLLGLGFVVIGSVIGGPSTGLMAIVMITSTVGYLVAGT